MNFFKNNSKAIVLWLVIYLVVPSALAYALLYPKIWSNTYQIPGQNPDEPISKTIIPLENEPVTSDLENAVLGTTLHLKWHRICVYNNNELEINGIPVKLPYEKDIEAGNMTITTTVKFENGLVKKPEIFASLGQHNCTNIDFGESIEMTALVRNPIRASYAPIIEKIEKIDDKTGTISASQSSFVSTNKSFITDTVYWPEVIEKWVLIVIVWFVFVLSIFESCRIVKRIAESK